MSRFHIASRNAALLSLVIPATLTAVRPSHGALWEYRFTGVFYSDPGQAEGNGIGIGIFDGVDGANPQGASFVFSAVFDDTSFSYIPPQWDGTSYFLEWFMFPTVSSTISRSGGVLTLTDCNFAVERNSAHTIVWVMGNDGNIGGYPTNLTSLYQFPNPLPIHPSPLLLAPFSGGSGEGLHTQTGHASLRYRFNDASLTLVPAPAAAPLLALAGLTTRGRRRK